MSPLPHKKILVFEFVCGGGCYSFPAFGKPSGPLLRDGKKMLDAVLEEIGRLGQFEVVLPLDSRITFLIREQTWLKPSRLKSEENLHAFLQKSASECDHILIIAPEIDNALEYFSDQLKPFSSKYIFPGSPVIRIGSDKWETFQFFHKNGIPTPKTVLPEDFRSELFPSQIITKPRLGAGSLSVQQQDSIEQMTELAELHERNFLIQEFVDGIPASIAIGKTEKIDIVFPAMKQCLEKHTFEFQTCEGPLETSLQSRAEHLLRQVTSSLPEFRGYLGIDLVLGNAKDGTQDFVIEINPRMTSSFCVTRHLADHQLFENLLS
jgi:predicted ATP-grasp superfamily ATP-dependent carboligase